MALDFELSKHIKGDMGVGLVRYLCGRMGHIFRELPTQDHGIDAVIEIADESGGHTGRLIAVQIKCGESFWGATEDSPMWLDMDHRQSKYWEHHILPVIAVICHPYDRRCVWKVITGSDRVEAGEKLKVAIDRGQLFNDDAREKLKAVASKAHVSDIPAIETMVLSDASGANTKLVSILVPSAADDETCEKALIAHAYANMWVESNSSKLEEGVRTRRPINVTVQAYRNLAEQSQNVVRSHAKFEPLIGGAVPTIWHNPNLETEALGIKAEIKTVDAFFQFWTQPKGAHEVLILECFYQSFAERDPTQDYSEINIACVDVLKRVLDELEALPPVPPNPPEFIKRIMDFKSKVIAAQQVANAEHFPRNELQAAEREFVHAYYELRKKGLVPAVG